MPKNEEAPKPKKGKKPGPEAERLVIDPEELGRVIDRALETSAEPKTAEKKPPDKRR